MSVLDDVSYLDQCRIVCLIFIKTANFKDKDECQDITQFIEKELEAFDCGVAELMYAGELLVELAFNCDPGYTSKVETAVQILIRSAKHDDFETAAADILADSIVEKWDQLAVLLLLTFRLCRELHVLNLEEIIDASAKFLRNVGRDFINNSGGWPAQKDDMQTSGIFSSMVIVSPERDEKSDTDRPTSIIHLSPPDTPPFSIIPSLDDGEERESLSSATPPEILDRPTMTASLMQMMGGGGGDAHFHVEAGKKYSDDLNPPLIPSTSPELSEDENPKTGVQETSKTQQEPIPDLSQPSGMSQYIPHISIGVAAAAACIGLFVLKKTS